MNIKCIEVGYLEENCYLLIKNNKVLIIDPGDEINKIIDAIGDLNVVGVLITHHHFDHVGALEGILNKYNTKEFIFDEGKHSIEEFEFEVINTPGHTLDSKTYYFKEEKIMFTGDFLFKGFIGRTDLGGNDKDMFNSIDIIKTYNENIVIYPGHGEFSKLKDEFINNMYLI